MKSKTTITVLSDINYENLIAEIMIDGKFIGIVTSEPGKPLSFEIPKGELNFKPIEVDTFLEAISMAKKELLQN